jgi:hypothetical protein
VAEEKVTGFVGGLMACELLPIWYLGSSPVKRFPCEPGAAVIELGRTIIDRNGLMG